jgi:hypothetical protein
MLAAHPNKQPGCVAFNSLLGITNTSLLYFHVNEGDSPMGKVGMKLDKTQKSNNNQSLHQQLCILQKACSQPAFFLQIQAQSQ